MTPEVEILLVEDSATDAELTIRALKKSGIGSSLLHINDGKQAIDFLFCQGEYSDRLMWNLPKVVMLDLKMPNLNGKQVLLKIKSDERTKNIPVVILTASQEDPDIKVCYDLGANSYVVKPSDFEEFYRTIFNIGLYWMMVNHGTN